MRQSQPGVESQLELTIPVPASGVLWSVETNESSLPLPSRSEKRDNVVDIVEKRTARSIDY